MLFSKDVQEHLKIVLKHRSEIVKEKNLYLFGNPSTSQPLVGYKILKKYAVACGATNPMAITCTRLRKHLATLTQLFNMSENDMEQLASFMGHTLSIHRSSYRLPDDIYQTAKISKLLLLMENGRAAQFKGKNLDEIDIDLEENLMECCDTEKVEEAEQEEQQCEDFTEINKSNRDSNSNPGPAVKQKKKRVLIAWTEEQKNVVCKYFDKHIKTKKPPKRHECDDLIKMHPDLLKNKDWLKIKVFVQNKYTKKC